MKLYKIRHLYGAPKGSATNILEYLVAENDEEVFQYIADGIYWRWVEEDFEEGEFETFAEMKEDVMTEKGDLESEEGWEDAYYGVDKYGWEDMGEITESEVDVLKKLKILEK